MMIPVHADSARPKVFCIGFHKTGTKSMGEALKALDYRVAGPFGIADPQISSNGLARGLEIASEHDAVQGAPWPLLFRDLDRHFPDSRFVLTVRDPDRWIESAVAHFGDRSRPVREWVYGPGLGSPRGNEERWLQRYRSHQREVSEHFAGRDEALLVMDLEAGDGWAELCRFLDNESPDVPFPHLVTRRRA